MANERESHCVIGHVRLFYRSCPITTMIALCKILDCIEFKLVVTLHVLPYCVLLDTKHRGNTDF